MNILGDYLELRGLPRDPQEGYAYLPLIDSLRPDDSRFTEFHKVFKSETITEDIRMELSKKAPGLEPYAVYEVIQRHIKATINNIEICDIADKAILSKVTTHWLRHSFGTIAMNSGAKSSAVRDLMGHSSIEVTDAYIQGENKDMTEAINIVTAD